MIEITGNDIKELTDVDLRTLIGRLCEAELRANGIPTAGVTWGGHQNAKDGGLDVRVETTAALSEDGFIPNSKTGFQVKKPDMPHGEIINEMRPNSELRQVIKDLINSGGAYIIISSQGSTADSALKHRKDAMREALADCPNADNAKVDFYDRERVAGWVRSHPSLVLWVRERVGKPLQGWRAYENWAKSFQGGEAEYMLDGHIRLYNNSNPRSDGFSAIDGINELRKILHRPAASVRLVGLSGVGKTRLLQALFDERIGEMPLNQSRVFYADLSDSPNPDPRSMAERLIALRSPAILAVDNCPPELHRRITSICSAAGSQVSLITIEYDVRDDQPEETEVFRLEPASTELIEKVLNVQFDYVSQVDARTIAEFSGGNARIALALTKTIQRGENLANLRDEELFARLFEQRNEANSALLNVAEACSLVYSFNCRTDEDSDNELRLLGSLIGMNVREVYQNVSELKRRELVQQRSIWRAVLPQAIANRLAKRALENIPLSDIYSVFEKGGSERLLISFSRRLGYLHDCDAAVVVSRRWLSEGGLLGSIGNMNKLGINLFRNIAPINPEITLAAIERVSNRENALDFFSRSNLHFIEFTRLLRSLAYDKDLFARSVGLLCRFALSESPDEKNNSIRYVLKSLFYLYLSGTHATAEQRLNIITKLVDSNVENKVGLGITLLDAALEAWHFSSIHSFEFGARSRDYGYSPRNREEIRQWYKLYIEYITNLATSEFPVASKAKTLLAEKFRGLWIKAGMYDELESAAKLIASKTSWREGWIAIRNTKKFHDEKMNLDVRMSLNNLDIILKPVTLVEQAKLYALSSYSGVLDLEDALENQNEDINPDYLRVEKITRALGAEVGANDEFFKEMLSDILSSDGARLFSFGQGLADGCFNPKKMWQLFCQQLSMVEGSKRKYDVLRGFLNAIFEKDVIISEELLNESVRDEILATVYPCLQTSVEINAQGIERLKISLDFGVAPLWQYSNLAYGRFNKVIKDSDWCDLLRLISSKPEGTLVAIDILYMRIHGDLKRNGLSDIIIALGQELLLKHEFLRNANSGGARDYRLAKIVEACFVNKSAQEKAKVLCLRLAKALANYDISFIDCKYVLKVFTAKQPIAFLDAFLGEGVDLNRWELFEEANPISNIDDEIIINWCESDPETRYTMAAAIIPFRQSGENLLEWTSLALKIVGKSSDPIMILNKFKSNFSPRAWSGSRAAIMQSRLKLISDLKKHENSLIAGWACKEENVFAEEIRSEREWELNRAVDQDERFE